MVDRNGDKIIFTPAEQQEFDVPPELPVEFAERNAVMFEIIAQGLRTRAGFLRMRKYDGEARSMAASYTHQARRLQRMSQEITGLLAEEVVIEASQLLEDG